MNKPHLIALLLAMCGMLCACQPSQMPQQNAAAQIPQQQSPETSDARQPLTELYAELEDQIGGITAGSYPNLSFTEDFTAVVPQASKLCSFTMMQQADPSPEECVARFQELFPIVFGSTEGRDTLCRICSPDLPCSDGSYPDNYPFYAEHAQEILSGSTAFTLLFADTPEGHLAIHRSGRVHAYNGGKTAARSAVHSGAVGMYFPDTEYPMTAAYDNADTADAYALTDRTVPVSEAADTVEAWIRSGGFGGGSVLEPYVTEVRVLDLGEGQYGYSFAIASSFGGVPIDVYRMTDDGTVSFTKSSAEDDREYERTAGSAFMLESTAPDIVIGYDNAYELSVTAEHDSVIPLTDAVQAFSDAFPENAAFRVSRAQLMYAVYRSGQSRTLTSELIWKFTAHSANDALTYVIYIDALDGTCHYYAC